MNITREFLQKRIENLKAKYAEETQLASTHQALAHTLNGARQDAEHMLAVFDGKVPATGDVPTGFAGVATDVAMDAEVNKGNPKKDEVQ